MSSSPRKLRRQSSPRAKPARREWVFDLSGLKAARAAAGSDGLAALLGGKGAKLAEMTALRLPVPPGFVVTTEACRAAMKTNAAPPGLWEQVDAALARLETATGRRFGDPAAPLLVSCRSGAKLSMPGMMDTVLNLGLNDAVAEALARETGDARFAYDAYRRLAQMFGTVVLGAPDEPFEAALAARRAARGVGNDAELPAEDLRELTQQFKRLAPFPQDPKEQLRAAVLAVFRSWSGKRARDYRAAAGIPDDLGTAVNVVSMVFGNLGLTSATGVATTRDVTTGAPQLEGDFLVNAQGEDVVAGTRATRPIAELDALFPAAARQLRGICKKLERHYREVQDVEFTIERNRLWMLQTRTAKRTAQAAIRIAVDLANEKVISRREAVLRVGPDQVDAFLHPQLDAETSKAAVAEGALLGSGLNVSPGAAIGRLAFDADTAEAWAKAQKPVIMARPETKPDDVHGLLAANGVLTSRGGRTSHAALVARQFGKPAVVGAMKLVIDPIARTLTAPGGRVLREGDFVSIDGTRGDVYAGELKTVVPDLADPRLTTLLQWADQARRLGVYANADYPRDAERARQFGAEGIGLCRTEHMFFEPERLAVVQAVILAPDAAAREAHLKTLLPLQRADFEGLFTAMNGLPVTIRLIDPPLHEFLPSHDDLQREVTRLQTRFELCPTERPALETLLAPARQMLAAVERLREQNPMMGLRGVRLAIHMPELVRMQVRALFEAACACAARGVKVLPKVMVPLTAMSAELQLERAMVEDVAKAVMAEQGRIVAYRFGTMIEVPRAALVAGRLAEHAEFFSFGTNDLTQATFGISRDDAEPKFLAEYLKRGILKKNPFATLDQAGVGELMRIAIERGRARRKGLDVGICGEHGGDPETIAFCHEAGLDYVSCSPYRVPIARLAAAHAALRA
ncbi:MAG: pyruvate, phosphate dikinase [Myxococcaceae bacterium]|nr:pyruvate, phosphate dikinase [Myxococcaceae bacterium]